MHETSMQIKNVSVRLGGKDVLHRVSVELPAGNVVGFIGPSGAGKTTLIRSIVGRQKIAEGSITVAGLPAGSPGLRKRMSYMTQEVSVYGDLTVTQNLRYFASMSGMPRKQIKAAIAETLKAVDMTPQASQVAGSLSGGQKQRLSLAIALLGKPEFMVLDEPTVGLDPLLREQLWKLFRELVANGTTLLISSHVMDEAERCDDLLLIREGKVLAHDSPHKLCERTGSKTVEESFLKLVGEKR
ncbi:MAG TPA: ABC transporter ATP-binding protein [Candidatus Saccharimonadales bacterium]